MSKRKVSEAIKKQIAGKQYYRCANRPGSQLVGLADYLCPLWNADNDHRGNFDRSGYEIDHIVEHSVSGDDSEDNLQALCKLCHMVKTKKFGISRGKTIKYAFNIEHDKTIAMNSHALCNACEVGDIQQVKKLLACEKIDPSYNDNEAIRTASFNEHAKIVKMLLADHRVNPADKNNEVLRFACVDGSTEIVKLLLSHPAVDPSDRDLSNEDYDGDDIYEYPWNSLEGACCSGHIEIVKILLASKRVDPSDNDNDALRYACCGDGDEWMEIIKLLQKDIRVIKTGFQDHMLYFKDNRKVYDLLIAAYNYNKNDPSKSDNLAIRDASWRGDLEWVKSLLADPRVDPSASNNQVIVNASDRGHTEIVTLLLADKRVDPSARNNYSIRGACFFERTGTVRVLLADKRVDPSASNNEALNMASTKGYIDIVRMLLEDERVIKAGLERAMQHAEAMQHTDIYDMLVAAQK